MATVYSVLLERYTQETRTERGDFEKKVVRFRQKLDDELARVQVRWGPFGNSAAPATLFSCKLPADHIQGPRARAGRPRPGARTANRDRINDMAALQGQVSLGMTALVAGTPQTVCRVKAPTNQRVRVLGYGFFFDGTSNSAQPVQVQIGRISADGTFTAADSAAQRGGVDRDVPDSAVGVNASAEPTYSNYLKTLTVHPQLGYEYLAPLGQEIVIKGGGMLGFVINAPAAVNVRGYVMFEE